ncbi:hypothetical protein CDV31_016336 [Fusarium ambrosium]|uniref:Uncharacterized protein n=1 Tax=Fusarium ambrosium TaxID=131363 RepID=A0A428SAT4_9HYPO|nr:hypothetical protein CDV31_016336 [Fusarium ambrosium]
MERDLKATRVALANSQNQGRDQAKGLTELSNQVDAKAGQLEAALARAQFSLKKVKEECNSQEEELRKMAKSQAHYKSKVQVVLLPLRTLRPASHLP